MSEREAFEIDTELTRDAIYAGIWTRLCNELRQREKEDMLGEYIERFANERGDPAELLDALHHDTSALTEAQRRLLLVHQAALGSIVELDDVRRWMPTAWDKGANPWLWAPTEVRELEDQGADIVPLREFGSHEQLRGDRSGRADPEDWIGGPDA